MLAGAFPKCREDEDTSFERPAGRAREGGGREPAEALADAIGGHDSLPSRACHSRFDMTKVRQRG